MREILFRGKLKNGMRIGEWVEGFFVEFVYPPTKEKETYIQTLKDDGTLCLIHEVDPETVGQYTGLKDKNGKRIFEGDILKIAKSIDHIGERFYDPPLEYPVNVIVKWDLCAWMWETLCKDKFYLSFPNAWCHYECEVIGNAHDNPALLEVR